MGKAKKTTTPRSGPTYAYVVFGKDEFLRSRRLRALLKELLEGHDASVALTTFEGGSTSVVDVIDECRTASLLAPLRVVCVRDADQLFKDGDENAPAEKPAKGAPKGKRAPRVLTSRELLESYLEKWDPVAQKAAEEEAKKKDVPYIKPPPPEGILVLEAKSWPSNTRLYKVVDRMGQNINCEPPDSKDFAPWLRRHAREEFGCTLDDAVSERLVEIVGENPGLLHMELDKLMTYVAPRKTISIPDVELLVGEARTEIVFKLMAALTHGDAAQALKVWHQVLAGGRGAEFMALGGLRYSFERLVTMKRLHEQGASPWDIKRNLKIYDPENLVPKQLERFSLTQSKGVLNRLLRIDVNSKSGLGAVEGSIEKLIVELCAAN